MPALSLLLPAAITAASVVGRKLLDPGLDLEDARFQTGRARRAIGSQVSTQLAKTTSDIRGVGASRRLSAGATQSAIAGATKRASQAVSEGEARLEGLRNQADQRIAFAKAAQKQQTFEDIFNLSLAGIGTLSKVALLKDAGLLDGAGNANPATDQADISGLDEDVLKQILDFDTDGPLSGISVDQLKARFGQ